MYYVLYHKFRHVLHTVYLCVSYDSYAGRDGSVGIVTRYRLDGPGIESRWGRDVLHLSRLALGSTQPTVQWVTSLFPGGKAAGRGVDHPLI
jgi:hypothetical protein